MLLRRITKHVQDQNWFAVGLDFTIVVVGILIAFQITNWSEAQSERAELTRAESALQSDLAQNYFNAAERLSLTDCRTTQLRDLADRLLASGELWEGSARFDIDASTSRAIDRVLRSPSRIWGSRIWEAGLARGTFDQMDADHRESLDQLFQQTDHVDVLQREIHILQARLKVLSRTIELTRADRLRYFDIISEIDERSYLLEIIAGQIVDRIQQIGVTVDEATQSKIRAYLAERNSSRIEIYGLCAKPLTFPFLEDTHTEVTP